MLGAVISTLFVAFITGALARFALPGPDPMPPWLTIGIGLLAGAVGFGAVLAIGGRGAASWGGLASFFVAVGLVVIYRRFVQKRPIWGREVPLVLAIPLGLAVGRLRGVELEHPVEDSVDEAAGLGRAVTLGQLQGLVDGHLGRDLVAEDGLADTIRPDFDRSYTYLDARSKQEDRVAMIAEWARHRILGALGASHYVNVRTAILLAEPADCRAPATVDWRAVWDEATWPS
jgi:hypothetical protein